MQQLLPHQYRLYAASHAQGSHSAHHYTISITQNVFRTNVADPHSDCCALQCVIQALKLVRGDNAVLPTLRHAAEQYHAQRAAPIQEISRLLAQVSLHAQQQQQQQQQQWQHLPAMQQVGTTVKVHCDSRLCMPWFSL
jgi:hypothetical protein